MAIQNDLVHILEDTIAALGSLDLAKLQMLEQRIGELDRSGLRCTREEMGLLLSKKRVLEILLHNCEPNLNALKHLHTRNMREQWAQ
jgi:hypothetical protein